MLNICAIEYVSLSELETVMPWITLEWTEENPDILKNMLHDLGMDAWNYPVDVQDCTHRNRFGNVITTRRWVGNSRVDKEWLESGYASTAAKDRALGNKLLIESYLKRGEADVE